MKENYIGESVNNTRKFKGKRRFVLVNFSRNTAMVLLFSLLLVPFVFLEAKGKTKEEKQGECITLQRNFSDVLYKEVGKTFITSSLTQEPLGDALGKNTSLCYSLLSSLKKQGCGKFDKEFKEKKLGVFTIEYMKILCDGIKKWQKGFSDRSTK